MKRYLRSLAHHPGWPYASFLSALGATAGARSGSVRAVVAGTVVMSFFWIPVLVSAAQHDYSKDS